jgi:hypothetical protein
MHDADLLVMRESSAVEIAVQLVDSRVDAKSAKVKLGRYGSGRDPDLVWARADNCEARLLYPR